MTRSLPSYDLFNQILPHTDATLITAEHEDTMASLGLSDTPRKASTQSPDGEAKDHHANEPEADAETTADTDGRLAVLSQETTTLNKLPITVHRSSPRPFSETRLGTLPGEIMMEILGLVLESEQTVDLTMPHAKGGRIKLRFTQWFPRLREAFSKFLLTCKDARAEGIEYLSRTTHFKSRNSDSARNIPALFGTEATRMIRRFELYADFRSKTMHERQTPALLEMLVNSMPHLSHFSFCSDYLSHSAAFPQHESGDPDGSVTRHDQERRFLLRFGAFLTHRHPSLELLVLPAASGPEYSSNLFRTLTWVEVYASEVNGPIRVTIKKASPDAREETEHQDLVMNSKAIRRLKWTELAQQNPSTLSLHFDSKTSEVLQEHRIFEIIDQKGYLTKEELDRRGLGYRQTVDGLIEGARRDVARTLIPLGQQGGREPGRGGLRGGRGRGRPYRGNSGSIRARGASYTARGGEHGRGAGIRRGGGWAGPPAARGGRGAGRGTYNRL